MATVALIAYALYLALAFGLRTVLQLRTTGSSGFSGISGRPGSAEWTGGVLFVVALVLGMAAPLLALVGVAAPIDELDSPAGHAAGIVLFAVGLAGTLVAQVAMGSAWRIGVDASERTELVTDGPFAWVRNPIFSAMLPTSLGLVLMVPSAVALVGLLALIVALQLQVRVVEEPYLLRAHGEAYRAYAARVGRFVPGVGRLRSPAGTRR
jgi:protein-S-isoprenylcysteine O-methyltransferase Ste14